MLVPNSKDVKNASETPVIANIEDNIKVLSALSKMTPVVGFSPSNPVSKTYVDLGKKLAGEKKKKKKKSLFKRKKKDSKDKDAQEIVEES